MNKLPEPLRRAKSYDRASNISLVIACICLVGWLFIMIVDFSEKLEFSDPVHVLFVTLFIVCIVFLIVAGILNHISEDISSKFYKPLMYNITEATRDIKREQVRKFAEEYGLDFHETLESTIGSR